MEQKNIENSLHWIQLLVTGLIAATVFCVKLQIGLTQIEQDFKDYKKDQKQTFKELDNRLDAVSDRMIEDSKDIEWIKKIK